MVNAAGMPIRVATCPHKMLPSAIPAMKTTKKEASPRARTHAGKVIWAEPFVGLGGRRRHLPANELVTWVQALVGGKLLNAEMQKNRLASVLPITPDNPNGALYGLGIAKFGKLYGHTGGLPGFNSFMGNDPDNAVTLVVWTNLAQSVDGRDPATTIARA